jgi:hypothetical protein
MLRALAVFAIVSTLHFFLSVLGLAFVLPAAFETQGGAGFWAAPGKTMLAWMSNALLAPLWFFPAGTDFGFLHVAAVSVLFGVAGVGLLQLRRKRRTFRPS